MKTSLAFVGLTATLLLCAAAPAHADSTTTVSLRSQHAPVTAAGFDAQACGPTGASQSRDRWLFALPAGRFAFTKVTARFAPSRDARTATLVASAPGPRGVATVTRATISTPRGLWLIGATATVRGKGKKPTQFTLLRTCAAKPLRQAPDRPAAPVVAPEPDHVVESPTVEPPAAEYPAAEPSAAPETALPRPSEDAYAPEEEEQEAASPSPSPEVDALATRGDSRDGGFPDGLALVGLLAAAGLASSGGVLVTALVRRRRNATPADDATQDLPVQPAGA